MDYKKHYNLLIERAENRKLEGYSEKHHIIPRCMGGTDEKDNIVCLTPEEHFVAHQLLVKMYPDNNSLVYAAQMMTVGKNRSNKLYGWLKRKHLANCKKRTGELNGSYGTFWITNGEENAKIKDPEYIPEGWWRGRSIKEEWRRKSKKRKKGSFFYITDGKEIRTLKTGENIPEGWWRGRTRHKIPRICITDGKENRRIKNGDAIPEGWWKGRTVKEEWWKKGSFFYITDGKENRTLKTGESIPEGWTRGKKKYGKAKLERRN